MPSPRVPPTDEDDLFLETPNTFAGRVGSEIELSGDLVHRPEKNNPQPQLLQGGLEIDPLLQLAEALETSTGGLMGLPSDISSFVDPALLEYLGELGLTEDMGVIGAVEDSAAVTLNAGEQRRRLGNRFQRQQELTGADLSGRGIFIDSEAREQGLVADAARRLGEQQGETLGDFNAAVGQDLRNILTSLGRGQLQNVGGVGQQVVGSISGALQDQLDRQQERNDVLTAR